jgi:hypothetical protein
MYSEIPKVVNRRKENNLMDYDVAVLGFDTTWFCRLIPAFRRNILSPSSGLK